MATTTTTNMGMILPVPSSEPGPDYAQELIAAFEVIDTHNHTAGSGVKIPISGITIDTDLDLVSNNLTDVRSVRLINNPLILATSLDLCCVYVVAGDLYYNNAAGVPIQITSGDSINLSTLKGIGGDYSTSTATEFYTDSAKLFTFWQDTNKYANLDCGTLIIHNTSAASTPGVSLVVPAGLSASYTLTFPQTLPPASTKILTLDASGNIGDTLSVDGITLVMSGNNISVPDGGVTRPKLAPLNYVQTSWRGVSSVSLSGGSYPNYNWGDMPNLTITITTTGRPVMMMLIPDGEDRSQSGEYSRFYSTSGGGNFRFYRDSTYFHSFCYGPSSISMYQHTFMGLDSNCPAGTHTYKVVAGANSLATTIYAYYYKVLVYELT